MANRNINIRFDASMDISKIKNSVAEMQRSLSNVKFSQVNNKKFLGYIANLEKEIDDFNLKANKEITSIVDFRALEKSAEKVINAYQKIQIEAKSLSSLTGMDLLKAFSKDSVNNIEKANNALKEYYNETKGTTESIAKQKKVLTDLGKAYASTSKEIDELNSKNKVSDATYKEYTKDRKDAKSRLTEAQNTLAAVSAEHDAALTDQSRLNKKGQLDKRQGQNKDLLKRLEEAKTAFENAQIEFNAYDSKLQSAIGTTTYNKKLKELQTTLQQKETAVNEAKKALQELEKVGTSGAFDKLKKTLSDITGQDYSSIQNTADGVEKLQNEIRKIESDEVEELRREMGQFETTVDSTDDAIRGAKTTLNEFGNTVEDIERTTRDIDNLKNSMLAFFSISNTIEIFKRTIREAYQTVTELDKAMTETAVVTDFSVGDMWEALPRYTEAANKLGTTTLGAYETMTLFYQQGLKTNEVFEIGTETMKMARIAGMDYTKATDLMTAALRGFNMELNEVSAQRINDVYSELAAITAADTEEIADAMTRTASIANSAGMEFETTSAFLSQMIETTREAPENLGTAMKTIIARFQELKKSPGEIAEVDGEIIDANKIDTALKTIGVSLMDTNGQFRELDDVFLEIAERWDTLDKNTQRYIATVAAGSRQQSRFIAMMSNYERTMELVDAANNSAGASQRQFEKTVDSLESKVNKLRNAWDEFTVGIANSTVLKGGVDLLTTFLNTVNNLTGSIGSFTGSLSRILTVFAALKVGKNTLTSFASISSELKEGLADAIEQGNVGQFVSETFNREISKGKIDFSKVFEGKDSNYLRKVNDYAKKHAKTFSISLTKAFRTATPKSILDSYSIEIEQELLEIEQQIKKGEITVSTAVNRYNAKLQQLGQVQLNTAILRTELGELENTVNNSNSKINITQNTIQSIGMISMLVGGGLMTLSNKFGDLEAAASGAGQGLLTAGSSAASLISILGPLLKLGTKGNLVIAGISVALGILSGVLGGIDKQRQLEKEKNEELIAQGKEVANTYKEQSEALKSFKQVEKDYINGIDTRENLVEVTNTLIDKYELENIAVKELSYNYKELNKQVLENVKAKLNDQLSDASDARKAASEEIVANDLTFIAVTRTNYDAGYYDENAEERQIGRFIDNRGDSFLSVETSENAGKISINSENLKTVEGRIEAYEKITAIIKELEDTYSDEILEESNYYNYLLEWQDKIDNGIEDYLDALETEKQLKLEILDIENQLGETGFKRENVQDYSSYIKYRDQLVQQGQSQGLEEEDIGKYLSSDNSFGRYERNYQQVQSLVDYFKEDDRALGYFNSLAQKGLLAYSFSINLDEESFESLDEYAKRLEEVFYEQQEFIAHSLANSGLNVLNALNSEEGLAGLDDQQLQEYITTLGMIPGLYNQNKTAYQEWIDIVNSGAGSLEQAAYINDLLQHSYDNNIKAFEVAEVEVAKLVQLTDSLVAQNEIAAKAVGLISKSYKIDPENLETVLNIFPEIARGAEVLADGTIKLNQEVAKSVLGDMNAIVEGDVEKTKQLLKNKLVELELELSSQEQALQSAQDAAGDEAKIQEFIANANIETQTAIAEALYGTEAVAKLTNAEITNSEIDIAEEAVNTAISMENISSSSEINAKNVHAHSQKMVKDLFAVAKAGENASKAIAGQENAKNQSDLLSTGPINSETFVAETVTSEYRNIEELKSKYLNKDKDGVVKGFDFTKLKVNTEEFDRIIEQLGKKKQYTEKEIADIYLALSKLNSSFEEIELGSGLDKASDKASDKAEKWINSYDKLYNLVRKINKALRMREKYERQYQRAVEDSGKSTADLLKNLNKQENKLNQIIQREKTLIKKRKAEATAAEKSTIFGKTKYSYYATYDDKNNIVNINWGRINKVKNEETGKKIEDYIKKLEEIQDEIEGANDTIEDSNDILKELNLEGREEYLDLEQRVFDAIVKKQQDQIDALSQIDDSINDANQSLIDSIQNSLSKQRQERDNERKEEEIAEKERRLAYLRRDTSNANSKEIRQLEEEIANAKEDYTDSLIDQKISELQEQNDAAAEQRQQQIELLQGQLDADVKNGVYWEEVKALIENGTTITGGLLKGSELEELLQSAEGWQGMSETQRTVWVEDLMETIKQALAWKERDEGTNPLATPQKGMSLEDMLKYNHISAGDMVGVNTDTSGTIFREAKADGTVFNAGKAGDGVTFTYSGLTWTGEKDSSGRYIFDKSNTDRKENKDGSNNNSGGGVKQNYDKYGLANYKGTLGPGFTISGEKVKQLQQALKNLGYSLRVDGEYGPETIAAVKAYQRTRNSKNNAGLVVDGIAGPRTLATFAKMAYKTGGLADFTGPAWLDGTKSKPELVLNAKDTQNFIQLKNILSQLLSGGSFGTSANSGDSYYEIHIEVDELSNDYDVEQLASKVKRMINEDARYRNVNAISLLR